MAHEILIAPVTVVRRRQLSVRRRRPIIVRHYTQREEAEREGFPYFLPPFPLLSLHIVFVRNT